MAFPLLAVLVPDSGATAARSLFPSVTMTAGTTKSVWTWQRIRTPPLPPTSSLTGYVSAFVSVLMSGRDSRRFGRWQGDSRYVQSWDLIFLELGTTSQNSWHAVESLDGTNLSTAESCTSRHPSG